jgi:hypothetical protein
MDRTTKVSVIQARERHAGFDWKIIEYQKPATKKAMKLPKAPTRCMVVVNEDLWSRSAGKIPDRVINRPESNRA